jgi:hypothetical protein
VAGEQCSHGGRQDRQRGGLAATSRKQVHAARTLSE